MVPYVVNADKTECKNLLTGKIYPFTTYEEMSNQIAKEYNFDKEIKLDSLFLYNAVTLDGIFNLLYGLLHRNDPYTNGISEKINISRLLNIVSAVEKKHENKYKKGCQLEI